MNTPVLVAHKSTALNYGTKNDLIARRKYAKCGKQ
jgi:hypothetical protein